MPPPTHWPTLSQCRPASTNTKSANIRRRCSTPLGPDQRHASSRHTAGAQDHKTEYEDALAVKTSAEAFFLTSLSNSMPSSRPRQRARPRRLVMGRAIRSFAPCGRWRDCPALRFPCWSGTQGLPIGVQLIGPAEKDDRLLRTARWLQTILLTQAE